jgi:hypothetical protein
MKKPKDIAQLESRLTDAATTPLVQAPLETTAPRERPRKGPKRGSVSVFLRLPPQLFAQIDAEAVNRTKATGRGVTVQQVILDKLAGTA